MSTQSLYRKWRSQTFAEVVGQEHVTRTLLNALASDRVAHAYLFCGPRGTGKTTSARLLAKAINCETNEGRGKPCNKCESCEAINDGRSMDIVEIDGASNRNIDDIRELREKIGFAPGLARRKVYIIDEVHQLTSNAFDALLKTLEEPPAHAVFVLASTEAHKIPATILSRCQRFDFRRISVSDMVGQLRMICREEGIAVEDEALTAIARSATGSLRDAESVLDQARVFVAGTITLGDVQELLGNTGNEQVEQFVKLTLSKDFAGGLQLIARMADDGVDMRQLARETVGELRDILYRRGAARGSRDEASPPEEPPLAEVLRALKLFSRLDGGPRANTQPQLALEIALAEFSLTEEGAPAPAAAATVAVAPPVTQRPPSRPAGAPPRRPIQPPETLRPPAVAEQRASPVAAGAQAAVALDVEQVLQAWPRAVEEVARKDSRLRALLRDCHGPVSVEGDCVCLGFAHAFHKEALEEPANRATMEDALNAVLGSRVIVRCQISERAQRQAAASPLEDPLVREALARGARVKGLKTTENTENDQS